MTISLPVEGASESPLIFIPISSSWRGLLLHLASILEDPDFFDPEYTEDELEQATAQLAEQILMAQARLGEIFPTMLAVLPSHLLLCDGTTYLRTSYPSLYAVLATAFIVDADHFKVPDLRGRVVFGAGQGVGLTNNPVGFVGGKERRNVTIAEMPAHTHTTLPHTHTEISAVPALINGGLEAPAAAAIPSTAVTGAATVTVNSAGSGALLDFRNPYVAINYAVWAK